ncbi:MAG: orotidine-5'-phosphate decarboxylase [Candidatus Moranbacteria bacterium]|nr:orotidine-5'-phosphate decarboxylase [Candidatus Moranbacteria bacterium]
MSRAMIIVALSVSSRQKALDIASTLDPAVCRVKVGAELFLAAGPEVVHELQRMGFDVFLDLRLYEMPRVIDNAIRTMADLGVWMVSVHTMGGRNMMEAAAAAAVHSCSRPWVVGATLLTTMGSDDLEKIGIAKLPIHIPREYLSRPSSERAAPIAPTVPFVFRLADLASQSGLDGVVCSGQETAGLREKYPESFQLVVSGIRLSGQETNDMRRVVTPEVAVRAGADYLLIGHPIVEAIDPRAALLDFSGRIRSLTENA